MSSVYKLSVSLLSKLGFYEFRYSLYSKIILRLVTLLRPRLGRVLCLDLGCSNGAFTKQLSRVCDEVIGLDIRYSHDWAMNNQANVDFIVADARRIPLRQGSMNFIIALSLLEHVPRWSKVIEEVSRILDKGLIIIQLPNLYFIIEPHTKFPLLAYLPKSIRHRATQINNYDDLQFDCTLSNVTASIIKTKVLKLLGIYAYWHTGYKNTPTSLLRKILPPPSYFIIALKL
jgi:SAM-dependent methyltransferase